MRLGQFNSIWRLTKGQRLRYFAAIASLVVASCFLYLAPLIPQITIDGVLSGDPEAASPFVQSIVEALGGRETLRGRLWLPALLVILATAIAGVFTYLRGRWSAEASESIARRVRDEVYDHLQRLPVRYFDKAETGDLIQRCTSDVETLRVFLANQVVEIGRATIMLLVPLPLMFAIDAPMTLVSIGLVPVILAFSLLFFLKVKAYFKLSDEAEARMTTTIQENLTGIRVVRAFARQDFEIKKMSERNRDHQACDYRMYRLMGAFWSLSDLLCFAQKAVVVVAGAYWLATGRLQVGAFYYFLTAVTMFIWPVRMMGRILADLGKAIVAIGRLEEILEEPLETRPQEALTIDRPLVGAITFDQVSFTHGSESPTLQEISFEVTAGETLAIVGPSGCGKSTIVNLLLRFYDYDAGSIRMDGRELREIDRRAVRAQTAVVMQEPFLYSKTLRQNITIGRPDAADDEMIEATETACVHESIAKFDHGYDTAVGERGVTLSGGQRQRVALARALLQEPAVLILDDALSAVDTETETMILNALKRRRGRHTTIVIAHRLSTLMHADQIIVLDHGRVTQRGSHRDLVAEPGLYRRLWEIQSRTETDEDEAESAAAAAATR
ncbi:MAG: ABC transporter ATP-binding protein [Phycisphaerales bacterium]